MSTTTANMDLVVPASGDTDYPTSISDSFTLVDTHDHTPGKGVQVALGGIAAGAVNAAALASNAVTTVKILDANVTRAKLESVGQQISASSGVFSSSSASATDVTNLSVSITTTGRPVFVGLMHDGTVTAGQYSILKANAVGGGGDDNRVIFSLVRGATIIAQSALRNQLTTTELVSTEVPSSSLWIIDVPSAGTYTYKAQVTVPVPADSAEVQYTKLIAYEL